MGSLNNEALFQKIRDSLDRGNPFAKQVGIRLTSIDKGIAETEVTITPRILNIYQTVHGGALYTLADTTAGIAAISATGCACVTLNSSISFLSPVGAEGKLFAQAKALRWGRRTAVCEVYVYDQNENLCVRGTFTFCPSLEFSGDDADAACETIQNLLTQE